jgi:hypothetical protein
MIALLEPSIMAHKAVSIGREEIFLSEQATPPDRPEFGDRLQFAIVLGQLRLGAADQRGFAAKIEKREDQLSKWLKANPRPNQVSIKDIAAAVGIDWLWLDDPDDPRAHEPPEFPRWWAGWRASLLANGARPAGQLPSKEEAAAMTGARATTPRRRTIEELEREGHATKKKAAKKAAGGGRGGGRAG